MIVPWYILLLFALVLRIITMTTRLITTSSSTVTITNGIAIATTRKATSLLSFWQLLNVLQLWQSMVYAIIISLMHAEITTRAQVVLSYILCLWVPNALIHWTVRCAVYFEIAIASIVWQFTGILIPGHMHISTTSCCAVESDTLCSKHINHSTIGVVGRMMSGSIWEIRCNDGAIPLWYYY